MGSSVKLVNNISIVDFFFSISGVKQLCTTTNCWSKFEYIGGSKTKRVNYIVGRNRTVRKELQNLFKNQDKICYLKMYRFVSKKIVFKHRFYIDDSEKVIN